jgi:hypothetical protein
MIKSTFFAFLIGALWCVCPLHAQQVKESSAKEKAIAFLTQNNSSNGSHANKIQRKVPVLTIALRQDEYYIFNDNANGGFVIVSGDERTQPILGYSDVGNIEENNIPANMNIWLKGYADQIKWLRNHSQSIAKSKLVAPSISPLLGEIEWGQSSPYNLLCPIIDNVQCPTGCVATAMAQIMCYYQWPATTKDIPGYTSGSLSIDPFPAEDIDWDNILPQYSGKEKQYQKEAVAKLMAMCGSSVKMDYGQESSSANSSSIPSALMDYFDYSISAKALIRDDYENDEWNQLIYNELSSGRPVIYGGLDLQDSGHGFVIDGYDKDNYFHVNWGWSGSYNGNFLLALLDPESDGTGYNYEQEAIIGIKKAEFNEEGLKDGDVFTISTVGEKEVTFQILSVSDKTCIVQSVAQDIEGTVVIPVKAKGFTVVEIGKSAFSGRKNLKKVVMPSSITKIGHDAFINCTNLESADIPSSVRELEYQAFHGCRSLTSIVIPDGIKVLPYNVFTGTGIRSVVPPGRTDNSMSAVIPESVTRIVGSAFACCGNLESVTLPASVQEVGGNMACASFGNPFVGCNSLRSLNVESGSATYHAEGNCIIETATGCISIGCNYSVIPSYAKHIGQGAFCNLNFKKFAVPEGILSLEKDAFNNSFYLEEVTLPSTISYIDDYAFYACQQLKKLRVRKTDPISIGNIFGLTGLETLYVPADTKDLYATADGWKDFNSIIEMETKPILANRTIDYSNALSDTSDLDGTILDNVYYNISNKNKGAFYEGNGSLTIFASSDFMNESEDIEDLFDEEFREQFTGIVFKVPAGSGSVQVKATSSGNMLAAVKIGGGKSTPIQQEDGTITIPYNVEDGTNVYIYGVSNGTTHSNNALRVSSNAKMNIYQIGVDIASINQYQLTYQVDGEIYKTFLMNYGSEITPLEEPKKNGYDFSGWNNVPKTMPAHNVTIEGSFTTTSVNIIEFNLNSNEIFTIEGIKKKSLQKGLNLIKDQNGKTKKVLIK